MQVTFIDKHADKIINVELDTATDEIGSQCLEILITSMTTASQELTFIRILNPDDHSIDVLTASIAAIIGNLRVIKAILEDSNLDDPLARFLNNLSPYQRLPEIRNPLKQAASTRQIEVLQCLLQKVDAYLKNNEDNSKRISFAVKETLKAAVIGFHLETMV